MDRMITSLALVACLLTSAPSGAARVCLRAEAPDAAAEAHLAQALTAQGLSVETAPAAPCDVEVTGRVQTVGYGLSATLVAAGGGPLARQEVSGSPEEVFDLIDRLGQRLARDLAAQPTPGTVVVADFANRATGASHPFVSGIPQMLTTALRQQRQWTLLDPTPPAADRAALAAARPLEADASISGEFTQSLRLQLEARVVATGRGLGRFESEGMRSGDWAGPAAAQLAAAVEDHRRSLRVVAVLPFVNHGEEGYDSFVDGLADMLTTSLGPSPRLTVIERVQIETAMRNVSVEMSGPIDAETAVRVGAWLGADAVVLGSFLRFGAVFRIDARMIDAETGEVLVADRATGSEEEVVHMVDELGQRLVERFTERVPVEAAGSGSLEVAFRMTKAEMGERPAFFHLVKLYVDGQYLETSPVVRELDRWETLFSRPVSAGPHRVQLVHGFVNDGAWDGRMPEQPEELELTIEPESTTTVRYTFEVGWFKDRFLRDP